MECGPLRVVCVCVCEVMGDWERRDMLKKKHHESKHELSQRAQWAFALEVTVVSVSSKSWNDGSTSAVLWICLSPSELEHMCWCVFIVPVYNAVTSVRTLKNNHPLQTTHFFSHTVMGFLYWLRSGKHIHACTGWTRARPTVLEVLYRERNSNYSKHH